MALTQDRARLGHRGELHLRAADAVSKAAKRFDIEPPKLEATDAADRAAVRPLSAQKSAVGNPYVFPGSLRGRRRARDKAPGLPTFNSFSKAKADLDKKLADVPHWTLHDLRRTARSLMSKAGVRPDIAVSGGYPQSSSRCLNSTQAEFFAPPSSKLVRACGLFPGPR